MTHIDPFAPADSPQHPANWTQPLPGLRLSWLVALPGDDPVASDHEFQVLNLKRHEELHHLIKMHGDDEERAAWFAAMSEDRLGELKPEDALTLREMRARVAADSAPRWIVLPDHPVPADAGDAAAALDARWDEYEELLRAYGTPGQVAHLDTVTSAWPDDMPTLVTLRQQREEDAAHIVTDPAPEQPADADDPEAELAAALQKLGRK